MSQGSFQVDTTTVTFDIVFSPDEIPGLTTDGRIQSPTGVNGGLYIDLETTPTTFEMQVLVKGTWADAADKPKDTLESIRQSSGTLTLHSRSNVNVVLNRVVLVDALSNGTNVIQQALSLSFTRLL